MPYNIKTIYLCVLTQHWKASSKKLHLNIRQGLARVFWAWQITLTPTDRFYGTENILLTADKYYE